MMDNYIYSDFEYYFPLRLQQCLDEKGISGKDLEDLGVVSASSIKSYVDGDVSPNLRTLCKIAEFLNVSIDWLCGCNEDCDVIRVNLDRKAPWL